MGHRWVAVVGCLAWVGVLGGCIFAYDAAKPGVTYQNNLDETVTVSIEGTNPRIEASVSSGGYSGEPMEECRGTAIVVETEGGELVGRVEEPACPDWRLTINEDGTLDYDEV